MCKQMSNSSFKGMLPKNYSLKNLMYEENLVLITHNSYYVKYNKPTLIDVITNTK